MSTVDPSPRPATTAVTARVEWAMTIPCLQGRELRLWRAATTALLVLAVLAGALASWGALTLAVLLLVPTALVSESVAPWWVRRAR